MSQARGPKKLVPSRRLWVNQSSRIYRSEATAFCRILRNAVVEDKARLASDLNATTPATSIGAVTSLLPPTYDYAGTRNVVNPAW